MGGPPTSACRTTTAPSCTTEPRLSAAASSQSSPEISTTSQSSADLTPTPISPTPTPPSSTKCIRAASTPPRRLAQEFPAPADGLPPLATLFAAEITQDRFELLSNVFTHAVLVLQCFQLISK